MAKAILHLGYGAYAMDVEDAHHIASVLVHAELYRYESYKDDNGTWQQTHYICPQPDIKVTVDVIPDATYAMYKLAGDSYEQKK
jgi:hypothetical protein